MDRKTLFVGIGSFVFIVFVALGVMLFGKPDSPIGTAYVEPYPAAPDFVLVKADGSTFQLSGMQGKIILLFFGYTSCPDVCPTTLGELNQALGKLNDDDANRVQVVFVTVDPGRDTSKKIQTYVNNFNPTFVGLSGTEEELTPIWNEYGVYREIAEGASAAGYLVNHTARTTLIDGNGYMRISFGFATPVEDIVHDLKFILKEK